MGNKIDRTGIFRAEIVEYGLREMESQAVAVAVRAKILEAWNPEKETWDDWQQYEVEATGLIWVVKKNGSMNQNQAEALMKHCAWDGSFNSIYDKTWRPTPCQIVVTRDDYKDQERFRISWINDFDRTPGVSNIDEDQVRQLQVQHSASLRAMAANVRRNAPVPEGRPPAPPDEVEALAADMKDNGVQDDVPF